MVETYNYCHVAELTDKGCKRSANEDWMTHFESPNGLVAVVCDGMGGHVGGQIASHTAVEAIQSFMMLERSGTPTELIIEAMNAANSAILDRASLQPELTGMGSTCVMLIVRKGKVYIGSVGDSRVYLIRNHKIKQLTVDQSYVQMLVDAGTITQEEAEHHHRKNEITNALGLQNMRPATVLPDAINPEAGDCFLLCSDGLSGMVPDKEIEKVVSRQSDKNQKERVEELIIRAKRNGGVDNITCQIVEFSISPNGSNLQPWWKNNLKMIIGIIATLCTILTISIWLFNRNKSVPQEEHSDDVKQLMATIDSIITINNGIPYSPGQKFMEIREDRYFNGVVVTIHKAFKDDTIITINHPLSIKDLELTPKNCIKKDYYNDSTRCNLTFNRQSIDEKEVSVTLHGKPSYKILIPIKTDIISNPPSSAPENKKKKKATKIIETVYNKITGKTVNTENLETSTDCTILVKKTNHTILINGNRNENADSKLYYNNYAFTDPYKEETDMDWYKIKNNGQTCLITIKSVPRKNPIIKIPTRPECNEGQGIILRIKQER